MKISPTVFHKSEHLEENELLPATKECFFCGSDDRYMVSSIQNLPEISLLKCKKCHACSASRLPTENFIDRYYSDYYAAAGKKLPQRVTIDNSTVLVHHLAGKVIKYIEGKRVRILDFGGGDGTVSVLLGKLLLMNGFSSIDIMIVDYNAGLVDCDDERIVLRHSKTIDEINDEEIDFVIASAVIEHIPNPGEILHRLLCLLRVGGAFYARTPYKESFVRLFRPFGINFDLAYPAHFHDLGQEFWEYYFQQKTGNGSFEILESKPSIVSRSFRTHFLTALFSTVLKLPWYIFGKKYGFVGGWEVFVRKD